MCSRRISIAIVKCAHYPRKAQLPAYRHDGDSGFDLIAAIDSPITLRMGEVWLVPTGLCFGIPEGYEIQVRPRSGLGLKGLTIPNAPGTIDSGYTGEVKVPLTMLSRMPLEIRPGARIAQAVVAPVVRAELYQVDALDQTSRGAGGFGSTGV